MSLKISMKKKIAKKIVSALGNVLIFGAKMPAYRMHA